MEVIIKFSDEDSAEDARVALDGWKWKYCVSLIDQELRNNLKYDENLPVEVERAYLTLRDKIREIVSDNNLTME
jgi:hypothetical protein